MIPGEDEVYIYYLVGLKSLNFLLPSKVQNQYVYEETSLIGI
jgi:hypothetical protein